VRCSGKRDDDIEIRMLINERRQHSQAQIGGMAHRRPAPHILDHLSRFRLAFGRRDRLVDDGAINCGYLASILHSGSSYPLVGLVRLPAQAGLALFQPRSLQKLLAVLLPLHEGEAPMPINDRAQKGTAAP
jgi:hypothetical protein